MRSKNTPELRKASCRAATAVRWDRPDKEDALRDLAAAKIAAYIEAVVETAPPLKPEQVQRLAAMLAPSAGSAA
jgi:hypothetical protein